ncbi:hypothetical protein [Sulfobacillus harzensis]|uniref:Uncharacterized protein n=1 Tax=Sulfobacillus harzensis TaxID=2729629 RepID=A0A7Y0L6V8_9FIRM|nr:hypothetical protein [Sulfobacillus harzensis]NMP24325.1 hypothetical protein [Sulfobacillus harzensis]
MNGWKEFLADPTPWSPRSKRWFYAVGVWTLLLVALAYWLLLLGIQGKAPAWLALLGQLVSVVLIVIGFWAAYRVRRRDIRGKDS